MKIFIGTVVASKENIWNIHTVSKVAMNKLDFQGQVVEEYEERYPTYQINLLADIRTIPDDQIKEYVLAKSDEFDAMTFEESDEVDIEDLELRAISEGQQRALPASTLRLDAGKDQ